MTPEIIKYKGATYRRAAKDWGDIFSWLLYHFKSDSKARKLGLIYPEDVDDYFDSAYAEDASLNELAIIMAREGKASAAKAKGLSKKHYLFALEHGEAKDKEVVEYLKSLAPLYAEAVGKKFENPSGSLKYILEDEALKPKPKDEGLKELVKKLAPLVKYNKVLFNGPKELFIGIADSKKPSWSSEYGSAAALVYDGHEEKPMWKVDLFKSRFTSKALAKIKPYITFLNGLKTHEEVIENASRIDSYLMKIDQIALKSTKKGE